MNLPSGAPLRASCALFRGSTRENRRECACRSRRSVSSPYRPRDGRSDPIGRLQFRQNLGYLACVRYSFSLLLPKKLVVFRDQNAAVAVYSYILTAL